MDTEEFDSHELSESAIINDDDEVKYIPFFSSPARDSIEPVVVKNTPKFVLDSDSDEEIIPIKKPDLFQSSKIKIQNPIKPKSAVINSQSSFLTNRKSLETREVPIKWLHFYNEIQNAKLQALSYLDADQKAAFLKKNPTTFYNYVPIGQTKSQIMTSQQETIKNDKNDTTKTQQTEPSEELSSESSGLISTIYNNLKQHFESDADSEELILKIPIPD